MLRELLWLLLNWLNDGLTNGLDDGLYVSLYHLLVSCSLVESWLLRLLLLWLSFVGEWMALRGDTSELDCD